MGFYQDRFFEQTTKIDEKAQALLEKDPKSKEAIDLITKFGVETGEQMTKDWRNFWMRLFARTRDFQTVNAPRRPLCTKDERKDCTARPMPDAVTPGYSKEWYARIVADGDNAEHYRVPGDVTIDSRKLQ